MCQCKSGNEIREGDVNSERSMKGKQREETDEKEEM
jgi:hypothetical protein